MSLAPPGGLGDTTRGGDEFQDLGGGPDHADLLAVFLDDGRGCERRTDIAVGQLCCGLGKVFGGQNLVGCQRCEIAIAREIEVG